MISHQFLLYYFLSGVLSHLVGGVRGLHIRKPPNTSVNRLMDRRSALIAVTSIPLTTSTIFHATPASARAPGSKDLSEAVIQIRDACEDLRRLERDWSQYATIDAEGRAGSTDAARRILGGIAPQAGTAAIQAAKATPLYRIDGAFNVVRQAAIEDVLPDLDVITFNELAERILFARQKADGDFYGVLFASKGTKMIAGIFSEARSQVKQGIRDLEEMTKLLKEAGAPGI